MKKTYKKELEIINDKDFDWDSFVCEQTFYTSDFIKKFENKIRFYTLNGLLHREDGPAFVDVRKGLNHRWFVKGKEYSEKAFNLYFSVDW